MELSDVACRQPYIREFYENYLMAAGIVIRPGDSHKVALSRQNPRVQENHTTRLRDRLNHAIEWENWATAKEIFDQILDVDPLRRQSPSPLPQLQEGDAAEPEPKRPRRNDSAPQFGSERRLCYSCRQRGHEIKDCPEADGSDLEAEIQPGPSNTQTEE
jgi:hypothetical protein